MTKLGVIFGGQSSEYSVSLHSVSSFLKKLHKDKYELHLIGISQKGEFFYYTGKFEDIENDTWNNPTYCVPCSFVKGGIILLNNTLQKIDLDCIFPVVHGKNAEDGTLQGLFEVNNIKYVGCGTLSSSVCMDKEFTHIVCDHLNIPTAKYICIRKGENVSYDDVEKLFPTPWIVKPCNAGSSYGVSKVSTREEFEIAVKDAFKYDGRGKILVEEFVVASEIGCAVLGNDLLIIGSIDQVDTTKELFDFAAKYQMDQTKIICPAKITREEFKNAQNLARKVYRALDCRGFARVDMFLLKDGSIILNEVNTIPGLTSTSRYPTMMSAIGIDFGDLIDKLISLASENETGNI